MMKPYFGREEIVPYWILIGLILTGLLGCSKEAKLEGHWKKGENYFTQNKFNEAVIEYNYVLNLNPRHAQARYKLGLSYLRTNNFKGASSEFSQAVDLDPNLKEYPKSAMGHYFLGLAYLGNKDILQAKSKVTEAVKLNPGEKRARLLLADLHFRAKAYDLAIEKGTGIGPQISGVRRGQGHAGKIR